MTPNCQTIATWIWERYPTARIQTTNCRKIAGSLTWSQHSWANALDIFLPVKVLDELYPLLIAEFGPHIAHILWRVKDHFDHIHLDPWPQGYSKPPCAGGSLRVKHKDGRIGTQFTDDIDPIEPEVPMFPIEATSPPEDIRLLQDRLNRVYSSGLVEDGVYGPTTEAAVRLFLGKMTGDPVAQQGKRVVANQWNGMTEDWIRKLAGAGGVTEARVRQLIEASRIVT